MQRVARLYVLFSLLVLCFIYLWFGLFYFRFYVSFGDIFFFF